VSGSEGTTRAERRAAQIAERHTEHRGSHSAESRARQRGIEGIRKGLFGLVVVAVLGAGAYLAFGDFLGQRSATTTADAISVQSSMAGFGAPIHVKAGQAVKLDWWTNDAAMHLQGGVHTMISEALGLHEELPAAGPSGESRKLVAFTAPTRTGVYDIYCDTCCGGKASPTMHGKIIVDEA
jgi:cytochrome c oxidase subunit II